MIPTFESTTNLFTDNLPTHPNVVCTPIQQDELLGGYRNFLTQHQNSYKSNIPYQYFRFPPINQLLNTATAISATGFDHGKHDLGKITLTCAQVWLEHQALWRRFAMSGNEMIITKMGRRMFPVLTFGVFNLTLNGLYSMEVEVIPADNNRYKYVSVSGWRVNGVASEQEGNKRMIHPDSVQNGEYWQRNGVAFKKIKLTNKKTAKEGSNQIVLNSMHKYQLQLVIKELDENHEVIDTRKVLFKETSFIAVTAYQNDDITQLKIDHNPFAKAFRDTNADVSDHPGSPGDIYSLSPKRRRYSDYNMFSPSSQPLHHQNYLSSFKQSPNYAYNTYYGNTNFQNADEDKLYRKSYPSNYGLYYSNERHVTFPSTTVYNPVNSNCNPVHALPSPTSPWLAQSLYVSNYNETGRLTHDVINNDSIISPVVNDTDNNNHSRSTSNTDYWSFPKIEDEEQQLLSSCAI